MPEKPLHQTKRIGKRLQRYNKAQQEKYLLIREELKTIKLKIRILDRAIRKTDVFTIITDYDRFCNAMIERNKIINEKTDIVMKIINEDFKKRKC